MIDYSATDIALTSVSAKARQNLFIYNTLKVVDH